MSDPEPSVVDPAALSTRLCGNGQPNPCDINAECIVERDGSLRCVVRCLDECKHSGSAWVKAGTL